MAAKLTWRIRDFSDEFSGFSLEINDVDAVNYQDVARTDVTGAAYAIEQALLGVIIGNIASYKALAEDDIVNNVRPASGNAQVENALRIYGRDSNGKQRSFSIACPNKELLAVGGTDEVNLAGAEMAALVAALEAHWEPDGLAMTIEKAVLVGRAS